MIEAATTLGLFLIIAGCALVARPVRLCAWCRCEVPRRQIVDHCAVCKGEPSDV